LLAAGILGDVKNLQGRLNTTLATAAAARAESRQARDTLAHNWTMTNSATNRVESRMGQLETTVSACERTIDDILPLLESLGDRIGTPAGSSRRSGHAPVSPPPSQYEADKQAFTSKLEEIQQLTMGGGMSTTNQYFGSFEDVKSFTLTKQPTNDVYECYIDVVTLLQWVNDSSTTQEEV
jgi:uncharacterized phage infection (PIP) family protein YhgE